ncbi:hypothetical protein QYM36_014951 [Artemia franciscana]|uniref:Kinesin motor domain-containing protein n=3 Tax=Artemia franciscana TaxID=6661 RepID=A0AA88H8Y6_ARTSF|nr:hypothetical protein QYM36_014951 [Artemia franciscana]
MSDVSGYASRRISTRVVSPIESSHNRSYRRMHGKDRCSSDTEELMIKKRMDLPHHRSQRSVCEMSQRKTRMNYVKLDDGRIIATPSAAAAFLLKATEKLSQNQHLRKRAVSADSMACKTPKAFPTDYASVLKRAPPSPPSALLRKVGTNENPGLGKVRVMLRVSGIEETTKNVFMQLDRRRRQVTLKDITVNLHDSESGDELSDRRVLVAAPRMFAFDGLFTDLDHENDVSGSVLSDSICSLIGGADACIITMGHENDARNKTLIGNCVPGEVGLIPCMFTWLYRSLSEIKNKSGARFSVRISAMEIMQNGTKDLLAAFAIESEASPSIYLRDPIFGGFIEQCRELRASNLEKASYLLDAALANRTNENSHFLLTVYLYQYRVEKDLKGGVAGGRSRLHILDFNPNSGGPVTMSALGHIMVALCSGQKHIPHKETNIVHILKDCMSSVTCQTTVIAHARGSGGQTEYHQALNTVQLATRLHRVRRRKIRGLSTSHVRGGSPDNYIKTSGDEGSTSAEISSSEMSCDTVIYLGPRGTISDEESASSLAIRTERSRQESRIPVRSAKKSKSKSPVRVKSNNSNAEQWIDGPKCPKNRDKKGLETWVDGPQVGPPGAAGFMDNQKLDMISKWVERQASVPSNSEQWIDGPTHHVVQPPPPNQVRALTVFKTCEDSEPRSPVKSDKQKSSPKPKRTTDELRSHRNSDTDQKSKKSSDSDRQSRKSRDSDKKSKKSSDSDQTSKKSSDSDHRSKKSSDSDDSPRHSRKFDSRKKEHATPQQSLEIQHEISELNVIQEVTEDEASEPRHSIVLEGEADIKIDLNKQSAKLQQQKDFGQQTYGARQIITTEIVKKELCHRKSTLEDLYNECEQLANKLIDPNCNREHFSSDREYIEVPEQTEPVPTADSCLQVNEEDIWRSLRAHAEDHPLRALSMDSLGLASHFTGETASQGTAMTEWEAITPWAMWQHAPQQRKSDYIDQETIKNLQEKFPGFSWEMALASSDIGLELEQELCLENEYPLPKMNQNGTLSALRHPDGASNPHLDQYIKAPVFSEAQTGASSPRAPGSGASKSDMECDTLEDRQSTSPPAMAREVPTGKSDDSDDTYRPKGINRLFSRSRSRSPQVVKKNTLGNISLDDTYQLPYSDTVSIKKAKSATLKNDVKSPKKKSEAKAAFDTFENFEGNYSVDSVIYETLRIQKSAGHHQLHISKHGSKLFS